MKNIILFFTLLFINSAYSSPGKICDFIVQNEDIPTLAGGRVKPILVLAQDSVKFLTGKSKFKNEHPITTFCQIMISSKLEKESTFPILVEHVKTKKFLGLDDDKKSMSMFELTPKLDLLRAEIMKQKLNDSYKKDLTKVFNRAMTHKAIAEGKALTIYTGITTEKNDSGWYPLADFNDLPAADIITKIKQSKDFYIKKNNDDYLLELTYVKSKIFSIALIIALIGIFLTVLKKSLTLGIVFSIITILIETAGMTMRVLISGRAPITNMYETVLFSGYGALIIALIIMIYRKDRMFLLAGLGYNILCLFMMKFANNMLDSSIAPLVPVLRDNFWLSTHVTTIMLSYAALALSWLIANTTLIQARLGKISASDYRYNQNLTYTCIKVGIILLAAGIILGGIWADYSWGRFWGWDPKETGSLIVLLYYMVIVHGKYSSWINTHRFIFLSAAGFMTVMMAWFGVNYIIAAGLHSYGFSQGGAMFLSAFFAIQIAILAFCAKIPELKKDNA